MTGLKIITADERLKQCTGIKVVVVGIPGIGKTSLLKTIKEPTLCIDMEAGLLSVQGHGVDVLTVRSWDEARDIACLIGGANPAYGDQHSYSGSHYKGALNGCGKGLDFTKYRCIFIDSLTEASRLCLHWCKDQPQSVSERTGKPDPRATYGLLGQEMMAWLNQFQHLNDKDVIFTCILEEKTNEFNQKSWALQVEGSKIANELPGIVDEVLCLTGFDSDSGDTKRAFVSQTVNQWQYPAKDRSGRLKPLEKPDLGYVLAKIKAPSNQVEKTTQPGKTTPSDKTTQSPETADHQETNERAAKPAEKSSESNALTTSQPKNDKPPVSELSEALNQPTTTQPLTKGE